MRSIATAINGKVVGIERAAGLVANFVLVSSLYSLVVRDDESAAS
jgi:hypothetical protein